MDSPSPPLAVDSAAPPLQINRPRLPSSSPPPIALPPPRLSIHIPTSSDRPQTDRASVQCLSRKSCQTSSGGAETLPHPRPPYRAIDWKGPELFVLSAEEQAARSSRQHPRPPAPYRLPSPPPDQTAEVDTEAAEGSQQRSSHESSMPSPASERHSLECLPPGPSLADPTSPGRPSTSTGLRQRLSNPAIIFSSQRDRDWRLEALYDFALDKEHGFDEDDGEVDATGGNATHSSQPTRWTDLDRLALAQRIEDRRREQQVFQDRAALKAEKKAIKLEHQEEKRKAKVERKTEKKEAKLRERRRGNGKGKERAASPAAPESRAMSVAGPPGWSTYVTRDEIAATRVDALAARRQLRCSVGALDLDQHGQGETGPVQNTAPDVRIAAQGEPEEFSSANTTTTGHLRPSVSTGAETLAMSRQRTMSGPCCPGLECCLTASNTSHLCCPGLECWPSSSDTVAASSTHRSSGACSHALTMQNSVSVVPEEKEKEKGTPTDKEAGEARGTRTAERQDETGIQWLDTIMRKWRVWWDKEVQRTKLKGMEKNRSGRKGLGGKSREWFGV